MNKIRDQLIRYIKVNRVSTTELSDALGKKGSIPDIRPIEYQSARHRVGKIKCVFAYNNSNFLVRFPVVTKIEAPIGSRELHSELGLEEFCPPTSWISTNPFFFS